jgi:hypothetical protein
MKCPHCLAELRYRERTGRSCSYCQKTFALEPRENKLSLSDLRLRGIAERLSGKGTYRYTARQLAHAVILQASKRRLQFTSFLSWRLMNLLVPFSVIIFVMLCVNLVISNSVASLIYLLRIFLIFLFVLLVILIPIYSLLFRKNPLDIKRFEQVLAQFEVHYIEPWEFIHGLLPGRVAEKEIIALRQFHMPLSRVRAVVASFSEDVLDCLRVNGLVEQLGLALLNPRRLTDFDRDVINLLRGRPRLPLLLIHDASLFGSLMATILRKEWELTPQHRIIDLGLHPRHVQKLRLPWRKLRLSREWLQLFEWQASVPNGLKLTKAEQKWLRKGYETSVLFIPPAHLIKVVTKAVERAALKRATVAVEQTVPKQMVDPETQAQTKARSVGFMTWPS